ncbi:hypothetical protein HK097_004961, partial [Rhizophlyctis rosea]
MSQIVSLPQSPSLGTEGFLATLHAIQQDDSLPNQEKLALMLKVARTAFANESDPSPLPAPESENVTVGSAGAVTSRGGTSAKRRRADDGRSDEANGGQKTISAFGSDLGT